MQDVYELLRKGELRSLSDSALYVKMEIWLENVCHNMEVAKSIPADLPCRIFSVEDNYQFTSIFRINYTVLPFDAVDYTWLNKYCLEEAALQSRNETTAILESLPIPSVIGQMVVDYTLYPLGFIKFCVVVNTMRILRKFMTLDQTPKLIRAFQNPATRQIMANMRQNTKQAKNNARKQCTHGTERPWFRKQANGCECWKEWQQRKSENIDFINQLVI